MITQELDVLFADQCIFNYYFKNDIVYLPREWNYQINDLERKQYNLLNRLKVDVMQEVINASQNAYIIHYSGGRKPWFYPDEEYADIWWSYARQMPFYEEILARLMDFKISQKTQSPIDLHVIYMLMPPLYFKIKKWRYHLFKHLTFGKTRKHYKEKYKKLKKELKEAKKLKNKIKKV